MHQTQDRSENQYKTQVIQATGEWLAGLEEWTHFCTFTLAPAFYDRFSEDYLISQRDRAFNLLSQSDGEIKWAATVEYGSAQDNPHLHALFAGPEPNQPRNQAHRANRAPRQIIPGSATDAALLAVVDVLSEIARNNDVPLLQEQPRGGLRDDQ